MELSQRELLILNRMLDEYKRSIRRKRSWRASEKAASMMEAQRLVRKIILSEGERTIKVVDSADEPFTGPPGKYEVIEE